MINSTMELGGNVSLQMRCECSNSYFRTGDNVFINYGTYIRIHNKIIIGDNVFISYECIIFDTNAHSLDPKKRYAEIENGFPFSTEQSELEKPITKPIIIGSNVWAGMRVSILKGIVQIDDSIIKNKFKFCAMDLFKNEK